ncbi:DUF6527 family protein [Methylotenera sp.]|uniref:DUF6527 family protein n=1 Tax=Methylotenera sp. TaxID=2051956 RepID=UPI002489BE50|nr:DUF6527 family protein [Methylotenera sp.]MDI1362523.1 DUF6527 family protein [Methylotenera sp.]
MAKIKEFASQAAPEDIIGYSFYCVGCKFTHPVHTKVGSHNGSQWGWNGSMDKPTFTPSVLVQYPWGEERKPMVCHSFVTDGMIEFLADCTHEFAGKTVELPEFKWDDYDDEY